MKCSRKPDWWLEPEEDQLPRFAFEREWAIWQKHIGQARERYAGPPKAKARVGRLKVLVVPDLHAPFHDQPKVAAMLERERDADICVLMGDIGDGFALSRFTKFETMPYEEELAAVTLLMQTFSERFPIVKVIEGNHDNRLEKHLCEKLSPDFVAAIRFMTGGSLSPIHALAKKFPNIELSSHDAEGGSVKWFTTLGDAIFLHAEKYSRVPGAAVRAIDEWLTDFEDQMQIPEWRVMFQAHTHAMSWLPWRSGKLLCEVGCLCKSMGYMTSARMGGRPQRRGYVTLEQVDGRTDINSVRLVWLDPEEAVA